MAADQRMNQPPSASMPKPDYYQQNSKVRKTVDVIIGASLTIVGGDILNFLLGLWLLSSGVGKISVVIGIVIAVLIVYLLVRLFNGIGRRYISIGILWGAIVPLLILGSCLFMFSGG